MRSKEDINNEIRDLEEKYKRSRNIVDRARYCAQIKELKVELDQISTATEQKVVHQIDAPSVADHSDARKLTRGDIANAGDTFVGII